MENLKEIFDAIDTDHSGKIDQNEFVEALKALGEEVNDPEMQQKVIMFFNIFDKNDDGELDFDEFKTIIGAMEGLLSLDLEAFIRKLFEAVDVDGSKTLDKQEVLRLFRKAGEKVTMDEVDAIFSAIDTDGNGTLDEEEFLDFFKKAFALLF